LQESSVLRFTYELGINNHLPFLDVNINVSQGTFKTSVYVKETNQGDCLNFKSQCPEKYKTGVIKTLLHRGYNISSDRETLHIEINRIKQLLTNNGFPMHVIDEEVRRFLDMKSNQTTIQTKTTHQLFYENQMNPNYKIDERILKSILKDKLICKNTSERVQLNVYYKNRKSHNLFMKNNISSYNSSDLNRSHVVYKINCKLEDCELRNSYYIGHTQSTIAKRMSFHVQDGAVKQHYIQYHEMRPTRNDILEKTTVLFSNRSSLRLKIYEALCILQQSPSHNRQHEIFVNSLLLYQTIPNNERRNANPIVEHALNVLH
jgi:hypothetical protein